jgi:hypothetical protein
VALTFATKTVKLKHTRRRFYFAATVELLDSRNEYDDVIKRVSNKYNENEVHHGTQRGTQSHTKERR